jgi:hypothetical protein
MHLGFVALIFIEKRKKERKKELIWKYIIV